MDRTRLLRNIVYFTLGLGLITVLVEYYRNGDLQIEKPEFFIGAILLLGVVGGYVITWVGDEQR